MIWNGEIAWNEGNPSARERRLFMRRPNAASPGRVGRVTLLNLISCDLIKFSFITFAMSETQEQPSGYSTLRMSLASVSLALAKQDPPKAN